MSFRTLCVSAPSNIALIKYMGKIDLKLNLPENGSLSMTLNELCTFIELKETAAEKSRFVPEAPPRIHSDFECLVPKLSGHGIDKIYRHLDQTFAQSSEIFHRHNLKSRKVSPVEIRSANTFPTASGIASSASSFAALTLAGAALMAESADHFRSIFEESGEFRAELAQISRQGSGSSCRSFDGPFVFWEIDQTRRVASSLLPSMVHFVVLVSQSEKTVSSSEAHARVKTSPLWEGRLKRVEQRLKLVEKAILEGDLRTLSQVTWSEAWEMHSLFHTSQEPFSYFQPITIDGLHFLAQHLKSEVPPIVTLDAGPNIHVIVPEAAREKWRSILQGHFGGIKILEDEEGKGASILRSEDHA